MIRVLKKKDWIRRLFPTMRNKIIKHSLSYLSYTNYNEILVVGSGRDPYKKLFSKAKRYVCLDIIPIYGITDVVGDALHMPIISSSFDCVFATEVLEHLYNIFSFVKEINRVLKPGGRVIITVPFLFHQHSDTIDFWRPTKASLKNLFSNFTDVKIWPQGNRFHVICDLISTSFYPKRIFFIFRIFNHILYWIFNHTPLSKNSSTAPSGYLVIAEK